MADIILGRDFQVFYNTDTGNTSLQGIGNTPIENLAAFPTLTLSSTSNSFETYDSEYLSKLLSEQTVEPLDISIYYVPDNASAMFLDEMADSQQEFQLVLQYDYSDGRIAGAIVNGFLSGYSLSGDKDSVITKTYTFNHSDVVMRSMSVLAVAPLYQGDFGVGANGLADGVAQYQPDVPTGNSFIKVPASQTGNPTSTDLMGVGLVDNGSVAEFAMTKSGTLSLFAKNASTAWTRIYTVTQMDSTYVPLTRTVNGKPLSGNVVLSASDLAGGTMTGALTVPAITVTGTTTLSGNTAAAAVTATSLTSTGSLSVTGTTTAGTVNASTVNVSGNTVHTGTTKLTGVTTAGTVNASAVTVSGNTTHTGTTTLIGVTTAGTVNASAVSVSGNTTLTGTTTAGTVNAGAVSASSLTTTGSTSAGSLAVTGTTTLTGDTTAGTVNASTVNATTVNVSGNTVHTGTTKLTGVTTAGTVNASAVTVSGNTVHTGTTTLTGVTTAGTVNASAVTVSGNTTHTGTTTLTGVTTAGTVNASTVNVSGNTVHTGTTTLTGTTTAGTVNASSFNVSGTTKLTGVTTAGTVNATDLTLTNALKIAQGGTGSTEAITAALNIGALPIRGQVATTGIDFNNLGPTSDSLGIWYVSSSAQLTSLLNMPENSLGQLEVTAAGRYQGMQRYTTYLGAIYVRSLNATWSATSPSWTSWCLVGDQPVQGYVSGDLNDCVTPGTYSVPTGVNNMPLNYAGILEVKVRLSTNSLVHRYTIIGTSATLAGRTWTRVLSGTTWSVWAESLTTTSDLNALGVGDYVKSFGLGVNSTTSPNYVYYPATSSNITDTRFINALTTDDQATTQQPVAGLEFGGLNVQRGLRPAQFGVSGRGTAATFWYRGYSGATSSQADWLQAAQAGSNSDITSLSGLTTALSTSQGGTGNANGTVGQLTTARTFVTNLASTTAVSFNGTANNSHGVTGVLSIANGGTAASTAAAARTNLGLGTVATLSTIPVSQGGTGATTATAGLAALGGLALTGGTMTGDLNGTNANLSGALNVTGILTGSDVRVVGNSFRMFDSTSTYQMNMGIWASNKNQVICNYTSNVNTLNFNGLRFVGADLNYLSSNVIARLDTDPASPANGAYLNTPEIRSGMRARGLSSGVADYGYFSLYMQEHVGYNAAGILQFAGYGAGQAWYFNQGGTATGPGAWNTASDERHKSNIVTVTDALNAVLSWKGVTYTKKDGGDEVGLIAQDVEKNCPIAVYNVGERKFSDGTVIDDFKALNISGVSAAYHTEAIRELHNLILDLQSQITELKGTDSSTDNPTQE